jgi:hypothetical protein
MATANAISMKEVISNAVAVAIEAHIREDGGMVIGPGRLQERLANDVTLALRRTLIDVLKDGYEAGADGCKQANFRSVGKTFVANERRHLSRILKDLGLGRLTDDEYKHIAS